MYVRKPGDVFVAQTIGTYPELPDWLDDTPDLDPQFCAVYEAGEVTKITYTGPKGTVVTTVDRDGFIRYRRPDGTLLREFDARAGV